MEQKFQKFVSKDLRTIGNSVSWENVVESLKVVPLFLQVI